MNDTENSSSIERYHSVQSKRNSIPIYVLNDADDYEDNDMTSKSQYVYILFQYQSNSYLLTF
jgi:hypothetical protein